MRVSHAILERFTKGETLVYSRRCQTQGPPAEPGVYPILIIPASSLLRHCGRVMADNKPLLAIPAIGETVSPLYLGSRLSEIEGIKARVYGHVAANLYLPHIDFP